MANPPLPYDAIKDNHTDLAREAVHPQHVSDVLRGLALLGSLGLTDGSYILSGHIAERIREGDAPRRSCWRRAPRTSSCR
jgi:hypothetical protein